MQVGDSNDSYREKICCRGSMPLRAMRSDGADHPGAELKSRSHLLPAFARLAADSAYPFLRNRECGPDGNSSRNHGSVGNRCCSLSAMTWSRISRRQLPTQRSAIPFCHGAWTLVRLGFRPVHFKNVMTSASNFESRSRITYRYGPASGNASRNCWTTHSAVG